MFGNFTYCNPTKLYFGSASLDNLSRELPKYGPNVTLIYGQGSIQKNGIYDAVLDLLRRSGKTVAEIAGVMPNPTLDKLREGVAIARDHNTDLLLAVGGGSVCDYAKAVAVSVHCPDDPWETYFVRFEEPTCPIVPVGCVLTMAGTGSEIERRRSHHQYRNPSENWSCIRQRRCDAPFFHPGSHLYPNAAPRPDGSRHLRYFQPYLRTVLLRRRRQHQRLSQRRPDALVRCTPAAIPRTMRPAATSCGPPPGR